MAFLSRLLTELNGFRVPSSKPPVTLKATPLAADDSNRVNYQLFYRPEQTKFCNNARVSGLASSLKLSMLTFFCYCLSVWQVAAYFVCNSNVNQMDVQFFNDLDCVVCFVLDC